MHTHTRKINNQRKSRINLAQIGRLSSEKWRALARRSWSPPDFLLSNLAIPQFHPFPHFYLTAKKISRQIGQEYEVQTPTAWLVLKFG
jgi:hypothetical protein